MSKIARLRALLAKVQAGPGTGHIDVCTCEDCMGNLNDLNLAMYETLPLLLDAVKIVRGLAGNPPWSSREYEVDDGDGHMDEMIESNVGPCAMCEVKIGTPARDHFVFCEYRRAVELMAKLDPGSKEPVSE